MYRCRGISVSKGLTGAFGSEMKRVGVAELVFASTGSAGMLMAE